MPLSRWLTRFRSDTRGTASVEFALVVPILVTMITGVFEVGYHMTRTVVFDSSVARVARTLKISGSVGDAGVPVAQIKSNICNAAGILPDCEERIEIELIRLDENTPALTDFACVTNADVVSPVRDPGTEGDLMLFRACYVTQPFFLGPLGILQGDENGDLPIVSTDLFVLEP